MNLQKEYRRLQKELKSNPSIISDETFNYNINEVRQSLIKEYKDYLYNHIEWEHILLDAETEYLDLLSFNQLEKLAIDYGY